MKVEELLPIIFERSNASTTLWNIEFAVILGVLTFMVTVRKDGRHWIVRSALMLLFWCAQFFNARALLEVSLHRQILRDIFAEASNHDVVGLFIEPGYIISPLRFSTPPEIIGVFVVASIAVTVFIWLYPRIVSE